jgi:nitrogen fixation NifU-like protein
MTKDISLYHAHVMDHYHNKRCYGTIESPDFSIACTNPSCGDEITLTGTIKDGIIFDIRFTGTGCIISQAAASMLLEQVCGMPVSQARLLTYDTVQQLLNLPLGPQRKQCAQLALDALQQALGKFL